MTAPAAEPKVINLTLTNADTEYSVELPKGTIRFDFQNRMDSDIRFQFLTGYVATPTAPYATIKAGGAYESPLLWGSATIVCYFASASAGDVVEIIAWR